MPIEIKELHIRVSVNTTQGTSASAGPAYVGNAGESSVKVNEEEREAIVAECVEQVLHILRDKKER